MGSAQKPKPKCLETIHVVALVANDIVRTCKETNLQRLAETTNPHRKVGSQIGKEFIVSISEATFDYTGFFNKAANKSDATIFGLFGAPSSSTAWELDLPNSSVGSIRYTGNCWVKAYSPDSRVNDATKTTASFRVTGAVTRAVISS